MNPILKSLRDHLANCTSLPTGITTDSIYAGGLPAVVPCMSVMLGAGTDSSVFIDESPRAVYPITIMLQLKFSNSASINSAAQEQLNDVLRWLEQNKVTDTDDYEFRQIESLTWSGSAFDLDANAMRFQVAATMEVVDLRR